MSNFCNNCGAPLNRGAQFCDQCGRPAAPTRVAPRPPSPGRPFGLAGPMLAGFVAVGVCLCVAAAVAVLFVARGGAIRSLGTPPVAEAEMQVDPQTLQALEESAGRIEAAFRAGDMDTIMSLTHPALRASYQPIFEVHRGELKRVADLLATRRLVAVTYGMAEYEVSENGRTFSVTFEAWGQQWYLSSL